jgi:hypothetical protein
MSDIKIHPPGALRSGSVSKQWLRDAKPGPGQRVDTNLWQFSRLGHAHARYPGLFVADEKEKLKKDPTIQKIITERFEQYTLEQLLVSPVLPSEVLLAIREYVAYTDAFGDLTKITEQYKPAGYSLSTRAIAYLPINVFLFEKRRFTGEAIPAPCIIRGWTFNYGIMTSVGDVVLNAYIEGYGTVLNVNVPSFDRPRPLHSSSGGAKLDHWIISGTVQPVIELDVPTGGGFDILESHDLTVIVEPLIEL